MVFSINPGANQAQFVANALATPNTTTTTSGSTTSTTSTAPVASGTPTNWQVTVGANGTLAYNPPTIQANVGDTVTFTFEAKNHTVSQSSFAQPCTPLANGFNSGFMPIQAGSTTFPSFTITVNDVSHAYHEYSSEV